MRFTIKQPKKKGIKPGIPLVFINSVHFLILISPVEKPKLLHWYIFLYNVFVTHPNFMKLGDFS